MHAERPLCLHQAVEPSSIRGMSDSPAPFDQASVSERDQLAAEGSCDDSLLETRTDSGPPGAAGAYRHAAGAALAASFIPSGVVRRGSIVLAEGDRDHDRLSVWFNAGGHLIDAAGGSQLTLIRVVREAIRAKPTP